MIGFGERIKERRWQMGLTQKELSTRLGVTGSAISSYENNTRMPSFEILIKMSRVFHMSTDELLGCVEGDGSVLVDISELTDEQKKNVLQMVETYCSFNRISKTLGSEGKGG